MVIGEAGGYSVGGWKLLTPAAWQELLSCELLAIPTAFLFIVLVLKKPSSLKLRMAGGRFQFSTFLPFAAQE
jgi:hypothetical protein